MPHILDFQKSSRFRRSSLFIIYNQLISSIHTSGWSIILFSLPLSQPENILLYRKGALDIKIADFGLSVQVKEGQEMKTLVGTAEYVCK